MLVYVKIQVLVTFVFTKHNAYTCHSSLYSTFATPISLLKRPLSFNRMIINSYLVPAVRAVQWLGQKLGLFNSAPIHITFKKIELSDFLHLKIDWTIGVIS